MDPLSIFPACVPIALGTWSTFRGDVLHVKTVQNSIFLPFSSYNHLDGGDLKSKEKKRNLHIYVVYGNWIQLSSSFTILSGRVLDGKRIGWSGCEAILERDCRNMKWIQLGDSCETIVLISFGII